MIKNHFNHILRILVGHLTQLRWRRILLGVIHLVSFQTGDVKNIGHFPVSWGIQPESIDTNGFSDVKRPTQRLLKFSVIDTWRLRFCKVCIANREEPGVKNTLTSHFEIVQWQD